jgi:hypothetical protein
MHPAKAADGVAIGINDVAFQITELFLSLPHLYQEFFRVICGYLVEKSILGHGATDEWQTTQQTLVGLPQFI